VTQEKVITKIETQNKNPKRKSIYLDDQFAFGLNQEIVYRYGLREGDRLAQKKIDEILKSEERRKAKEKALNYLSYRARSEKEIKDKLKKKEFPGTIIDEVISDLKRLNLVDDFEFASLWIKDRLEHKPKGERILKLELFKKGIKKEIIQKALEEFYPSKTEEMEIALELVKKKERRYKDLDKMVAKRRLFNFLLRRGFSYEVVREALGAWGEMEE
jgi:regulatory protein